MDIIADAVRVGFVRTHEAMPLVRFREAVLATLPDGVKLDSLPERGEFDVRRCSGVGISSADQIEHVRLANNHPGGVEFISALGMRVHLRECQQFV